MVRSFVTAFEKLLNRGDAETQRTENVRTHAAAMKPSGESGSGLPTAFGLPPTADGTLLTGEMFAPILREHINKYNALTGSRLRVMAVPNTYFGGDVSVAGLLTGQDLVAVKDRVKGDFVVIPKVTIKSDEPIFLDGMTYDDLKSQFAVPVYDVDTNGLIAMLKSDPPLRKRGA